MNKVDKRVVAFYITTKCTLNCKLCSTGVPYIENAYHVPKDNLFAQMEHLFPIVNHIEHVDVLGGEPLLHPEITEIMQNLWNYRDKFNEMRIVTNGTIVPNKELLSYAKYVNNNGNRFFFLIDNYGKLSSRLDEVVKAVSANNIPYRVDTYVGDKQWYDGWVHYGDYELIDRDSDETNAIYKQCPFYDLHYLELWDGIAYPCAYALTLALMNKFDYIDNEYLNFMDNTINIDKKREIVNGFDCREIEFKACHKCNSIGKIAKRYPAAEQLNK